MAENEKRFPYTVPDNGTIWNWGWNHLMPNFAIDHLNGVHSALGITDDAPFGSFLAGVGDLVTGETAKNQNMELLDAANKHTTSEREAAQTYNAEQAKLARYHQEYLQKMAQQFNHDEAELNRSWQEHMSNTAYQRATADMKSAGLNPYLAYAQGGAPVSSSQSATVGVGSSPSASVNAQAGKSSTVGSTAGAVVSLIADVASSAFGLAKLLK